MLIFPNITIASNLTHLPIGEAVTLVCDLGMNFETNVNSTEIVCEATGWNTFALPSCYKGPKY